MVLVPDVLHVLGTRDSLLRQLLVKICGILSLVHDIGRRTRLRAVEIWGTGDLLPRSGYVSICLLARVFHLNSLYWVAWSLGMRMTRAVHGCIRVDDILMLTESNRVERIIVGLKSCGCLPCFRNSGALVACHILLRKPLLDCLCLPVIVPNAPSAFNHPGTKLSEH